jgi:hypothetical protein
MGFPHTGMSGPAYRRRNGAGRLPTCLGCQPYNGACSLGSHNGAFSIHEDLWGPAGCLGWHPNA